MILNYTLGCLAKAALNLEENTCGGSSFQLKLLVAGLLKNKEFGLTKCHFLIIIKLKNQLCIQKTALRLTEKANIIWQKIIIKATENDKKYALIIKLRLHGHDELNFTEVLKIICLESFIKSSIESLF